MQRVFRSQTRYWYKDILYPVLGLSILFAFILIVKDGWALGALVLAVAIFILGRDVLLPVHRNHLLIDRNAITGSIFDLNFEVDWKDLVAAWISNDRQGQPMLLLGTQKDVLGVSLKWMDAEAVWTVVRRNVGPWALTQDAQNRLWEIISCRFQPTHCEDQPLRAGYSGWLKAAGWLAAAVFASLAFLAWGERETTLTILFLTLLGASTFFLLVTFQTIWMDEKGIESRSVIGRFHMNWDEISLVQSDPQSVVMVVHGAGKRIVVAGPAHWVGRDREAMLERLQEEIETRQITVKIDPWLTYKLLISRNTRMRRK